MPHPNPQPHPKRLRRTDVEAGCRPTIHGMGTETGRYRCFTPAFNGGAGEVAQVVAVMQAPRARLGGPIRLLMVGDSKLVSYPSLAAMGQAKVAFIAPASEVSRARRGTRPTSGSTRPARSTTSASDAMPASAPRAARVARRVPAEDTTILAEHAKCDAVLTLRRVSLSVHSCARATRQRPPRNAGARPGPR